MALTFAVALICAASAHAADYRAILCAANNGSNGISTYTNTTSPQNPGGIFSFENYCGPAPYPAGDAAFIRIAENQPSGNAGQGAVGYLYYDSPPFVHFREAGAFTRQPNAFNDGWRTRLWAAFGSAGFRELLLQGQGAPQGTTSTFASHLWPVGGYLDFTRFGFELTCVRPAGGVALTRRAIGDRSPPVVVVDHPRVVLEREAVVADQSRERQGVVELAVLIGVEVAVLAVDFLEGPLPDEGILLPELPGRIEVHPPQRAGLHDLLGFLVRQREQPYSLAEIDLGYRVREQRARRTDRRMGLPFLGRHRLRAFGGADQDVPNPVDARGHGGAVGQLVVVAWLILGYHWASVEAMAAAILNSHSAGARNGARTPTDPSRSQPISITRKPRETVPHLAQQDPWLGLITRRSVAVNLPCSVPRRRE